MKHISLSLLLLVLVVFSCKNEDQKALTLGDFEFSQETIVHNTPLTITYNGNADHMEGFYYELNGFNTYPLDLNFENNAATITIPDSISAVAFNFKVDGDYLDNNKQGYLFPVLDKNGTAITGSKSSIEAYKAGNGKNYGLEGDADAFAKALEEDIAANPELKALWGIKYLSNIMRSDRKKGEKIANTMLSQLSSKSDLTEDDYWQMRGIYLIQKNNKLADSVSNIAMANFPNGIIQQQALMNSLYAAKTLDEKEEIFANLESKSGTDPLLLSYAATSIAGEKFNAGDDTGFNTYANKITSTNDKARLYNSVAWSSAEEGKNLETAALLSKQSLDLIQSQQGTLENKPPYYTNTQYENSLKNAYNMYADTYALIQHKLGNIKEAIKYQAEAIGDGDSAEMNERYIEFLVADKQYKLASDKASVFLAEGHGTDKMTALYKTAYTQVNPTTNDFDTVIAAIKQKSHDKELAELKKSMLDEDAPQFVLKNLDGDNISLASFKGKTVILDFWATWCGPCKASFPGMQQVVEKYKDDDNVVLLFVDTFEDGANREKNVAKFIKDNKYDFHVVIDGKVKDSDKYEVADKYGVTGIPTKVIIGPQGRINFKSVGFSGSNDKLKQEMDLMIDLLKTKPVKP